MKDENAKFTFSYDDELKMARVTSDSAFLFSSLVDVFTVANPSYFYLEKKGISYADDTFSAISPMGSFQIGMFPLVYVSALKIVGNDKSRISISDEDKRKIGEHCFPLKNVVSPEYEISSLNDDYELRWYQREGVTSLITHGRGICVSPTGSGKSLMIATLVNEIRRLGFPKMGERKHIILIVPTRQLVDQMAADFDSYGLKDYSMFTSNSGSKKSGTFKDNSCSEGFNNLIITNHAWIIDKYKNKGFPLKEIGCTIADEVHTVSRGTKILKVVKKIDSVLRFGFTGTLPSFIFDKWTNFGTFGITVFQTDIQKLQKEEFLSNIEIMPIHCVIRNVDNKLPFSLSRSRARLNDVLEDGTVVDIGTAYAKELEYNERNCSKMWMPVFERISEDFDFESRNMVVLFDRLNVGKTLYSELKDRFQSTNVFYIDGNIDVSVREGIRKSLEERSGNILVAQTVTASVGLNIKNLNGIVFAFSGRSYVRIIQSIGRVIRKKNDKSVAKLYEVWYNLKYSTKHHGEKMEILADNYGEESIRDAVSIEIEV